MKTLLIGWFDEEGIKAKFNIKDDDLYIISDKARRMIYKAKKTKNVYYINNVEDLEEYKRVLGEIEMKFDKVIMNPPYDKSLHLKIVDEVIKHINDSGEIINLSPIRWLQDPCAKYKNSDFIKYENICKSISSLKEVDAITAAKLFDAEMLMDLGVYKLTHKGGFNYKKYNTNIIVDKVIGLMPSNLYDNCDENMSNGYRVRLSKLRPSATNRPNAKSAIEMKYSTTNERYLWVYKDGYTIDKNHTHWSLNKNLGAGGPKSYTEHDNIPLSIKFRTKSEALNFDSSTKTLFYRYLVSTIKTDQNFPLKHLPYMCDYTQPWTNERFYKYFNITKEEQKIIEETMAQYETN